MQRTRVILAGSRSMKDYRPIGSEIRRLFGEATNPHYEMFPHFVSGGAPGADTLAKEYCDSSGYACEVVEAEWHRPDGKYDKSAGYKRNEKMADMATVLVAFWDGNSPGTKHMIDIALRKGLEVHVVRI